MNDIGYEEARMFVRGSDNCNASNCGKIVSLDDYYADFESVPLTNLPPCLLTELTHIKTCADGGWNDLAELVLHAPQLRELDLSECAFPPGSTVQLFNSLCSLHSFTTLKAICDDYRDELPPEDCQALGRLLSTSKSLTNLDIHGRPLLDPGIEYISNGLKQSTLHDLNISSCGLDSNGAHLIAEALCYNHTLRELDMSNNPIGDDGATALAKMLTRNQTLQTIDMQWCDITELGATELAEALCLNSTLTKINLSGNAIKDQGACALAQMLTRNQSLSELDIRHCSISGVGASHLARARLTNHSITHIGLAGNNITTPPHSDISIDPRLKFK
jgi:hypothetical protein